MEAVERRTRHSVECEREKRWFQDSEARQSLKSHNSGMQNARELKLVSIDSERSALSNETKIKAKSVFVKKL
jgi:hypothetical protein